MRLIYNPAEGEEQSWEFNPDDLLSVDAEDLEAVGGEAWTTYKEWKRLYGRNHLRALRAALWICLRREDPALDFSALSVHPNAVEWTYGEADLLKLRDAWLANPRIKEDERADQVELVDILLQAGGYPVPAADPEDGDPLEPSAGSPIESPPGRTPSDTEDSATASP